MPQRIVKISRTQETWRVSVKKRAVLWVCSIICSSL
jgi:hypothetical protein